MSTEAISNQSLKDIPQQPSAVNRQSTATPAGNELPQQAEKAQAESAQVSAKDLEGIVEQLNEHMQNIQRNLNFSVDDSSGKTVIRVDTNTEELVRQIPSEDALRISHSIQELVDVADGLILSEFA